MVDIADLAAPGSLDASDFEFRVGNDDDPSGWALAPAPLSVTVREGAGTGGSDRVTVIWADGEIQQQWLQVRVLSNVDTGLTGDDVFYFGNLPGDTDGDGAVNFSDFLALQSNFGVPGSMSQGDFNLDGVVNFTDFLTLQSGFGSSLETLSPSLSLESALASYVRETMDEQADEAIARLRSPRGS